METYNGHVRTPADAIILFEACRIGLLPRVQRRLSEKERQSIKSGSVFVWDEREAGMRRWTDGKSWSASRVSGSFLTYREMEGKRGGSSFDKSSNRDGMPQEGDSDGGPDGYRYKPDGLMKQSFSITTNQGQHLHLISYFSRSATAAKGLMQPSQDPQLRHIRPEKGMYPDTTVHEGSNIPAVTRGPMGSPGHAYAPNAPPPCGRGYPYHQAQWPPSPMHTPPPHHYSPYYQHPHGPYAHGMHYPPPQTSYGHPGMTAFDRPPPMGSNGLPPPPPAGYGQHPYHGSYPPPPATYHSAYPAYQPPPLQAPPYPEANRSQSYEHRPSQQTEQQQPTPAASENKDDRSDSHASTQQPTSPKRDESQASAGASAEKAPVSSGQTIPSISAMLNAGENGQPPPRTSSRSPTGPARGLQDIPSHKLGFEASRDVHTLRALDKTNFKF